MALKISKLLLLIYIIKTILFSNPEDFIICSPFFLYDQNKIWSAWSYHKTYQNSKELFIKTFGHTKLFYILSFYFKNGFKNLETFASDSYRDFITEINKLFFARVNPT